MVETINQKTSFAKFVYPLVFDGKTFSARTEVIDRATRRGSRGDVPVWQMSKVRPSELLPHVARFVTQPDPQDPNKHWTAMRQWTIRDKQIRLRFKIKGDPPWILTFPRGNIPFEIISIDLTLFAVGVGFLSVFARASSENWDDWCDFLYYMRYFRGQRRSRAEIQSVQHPFEKSRVQTVSDESDSTSKQAQTDLETVVDSLLTTGRLETDESSWYEEAFIHGEFQTYSAIFMNNVPTESIPEHISRAIRNFRSDKPVNAEPIDISPGAHPALIAYDKNSWFICRIDRGSFLACNTAADTFWQATMPGYLANEYFLIFLLALHQRYALMEFSERIGREWPFDTTTVDEELRNKAFRSLRHQFLAFTARGYFVQVAQRHHHHLVYQKWQDIFQIQRLYREVSDEVREMFEHSLLERTERLEELQAQAASRHEQAELQRERLRQEAENHSRLAEARAKRLETVLGVVAFVFGVPGLVLAYLDAVGGRLNTSPMGAAIYAMAGFGVGCLVLYGIQRISARSDTHHVTESNQETASVSLGASNAE